MQDEVVFLAIRDHRVLNAVFELSKCHASRLVAVDVANVLDLPTPLPSWLRAGELLPAAHPSCHAASIR